MALSCIVLRMGHIEQYLEDMINAKDTLVPNELANTIKIAFWVVKLVE